MRVQELTPPFPPRYILFVTQHYTSSNQYLLPLLESTTRRFLSDARYAQDARYLKLWVMYARHVERREEVWAFLESREVGTRHAVFYEEWAGAVEALGR
jgi:checkpoint serine/threonine-protein kinase